MLPDWMQNGILEKVKIVMAQYIIFCCPTSFANVYILGNQPNKCHPYFLEIDKLLLSHAYNAIQLILYSSKNAMEEESNRKTKNYNSYIPHAQHFEGPAAVQHNPGQ